MVYSTLFPSDFYDYLNSHSLIGVKGGRAREGFLNIWMVRVNDRCFSRSWNKSEKSWFTEFFNSGIGQIKYGETIINVRGKQLPPNDPLQKDINMAYLKKYNQPENLFYSEGITQPEYSEYTMEFFIDQKLNK